MAAAEVKKPDLPIRIASAGVMVALAATALWLGGWYWVALLAAGGSIAFYEWFGLVLRMFARFRTRAGWTLLGLAYIGGGCWVLWKLRDAGSIACILAILGAVIATDVGAYFTGRSLGGAKIAPAVSPSKTWSGLAGGIVAAGVVGLAFTFIQHRAELAEYHDYVAQNGIPDDWSFEGWRWGPGLLAGAAAAIVAQAGDFFESWMKRRAGVKDSSRLIPGHGGLLDRVDGILAVLAVLSLYWLGVSGAEGPPWW